LSHPNADGRRRDGGTRGRLRHRQDSASFAGRLPVAHSSRTTRRTSSATISRSARSSKRLTATLPGRARGTARALARSCRSLASVAAARSRFGGAGASVREPPTGYDPAGHERELSARSGRNVTAFGRAADPHLVADHELRGYLGSDWQVARAALAPVYDRDLVREHRLRQHHWLAASDSHHARCVHRLFAGAPNPNRRLPRK
jgi:hypothetical protein